MFGGSVLANLQQGAKFILSGFAIKSTSPQKHEINPVRLSIANFHRQAVSPLGCGLSPVHGTIGSTIINTAVPSMAASLNVTPLSLKAVVASYILSLAVGIPISGWMADRFGTRRVFSFAVIIFTFTFILCGLSVNIPMLVAARILQGLGAAMMMPVGRLAIIRTF